MADIPPKPDKVFCQHSDIFYSRWYLWNEPNQWVVHFEVDATHRMRFCKICRVRQLRG